MTNCEKCIHNKVCERSPSDAEKLGCGDFKDESKIIELPCRIGDTVYLFVSHFCKKLDDCIFACNGLDLDCAEYNGDIDIVETEFEIEWLPEIGETVFLTKAAAEQALKERDSND